MQGRQRRRFAHAAEYCADALGHGKAAMASTLLLIEIYEACICVCP